MDLKSGASREGRKTSPSSDRVSNDFRKPVTTARLRTLQQAIVHAPVRRRLWIAFVLGASSALVQAPTHFWPILFVTLPLLVWLIDGAPGQRWRGVWACAVIGWCFGFGYFLAGFYWIGHAFLVDAKTFGWLLPIAVTGLPAFLGIFTSIGVACARLLWAPGATRILDLAVTLTAVEWLRGHVLTGFPWNAFGYALASPLPFAQGASVVGLWGLTFIALAVFASPATLTDHRSDTRWPWLPLLLAVLLLVVLALFGWWRLSRIPTSFVDGVALRIMQPNLQQDDKFNYSAKAAVMSRYINLSRGGDTQGLRGITHVIWPESAFPFYLTTEPDALAQIAALLPEKTLLITGADRVGAPPAGAANTDSRTSIYVIDHAGTVLALYDKVHLVPFGEFLPLEGLLNRLGLTALTKVAAGLLPGERRQVMSVPGAPSALPLLCYEVIFPDEMTSGKERAGWLLNLTNDGWFGTSSGPYQHFAQARLRAIEQGLPLVRAANTGISAVVDPVGRIVGSLSLGSEGVLDAPLPQAIAPTPYARFGDAPAAILVAFAFAVVVCRRMRVRRSAFPARRAA
jgi:apolipoprotein N-acyltransferase